MMNALRLNDGFPPPLFTERTGLPLAAIEEVGAGGTARRAAGVPAGIGSDQDRYFSAAFSTTVRGFPLSTMSVLTNRAGVLPTFLK
jgi:hypothetical protein